MKKIISLVLVLLSTIAMSMGVFAYQSFEDWYYEQNGVRPDADTNWFDTPEYDQYEYEMNGASYNSEFDYDDYDYGNSSSTTYYYYYDNSYDAKYYPSISDTWWDGKTARWSTSGNASKYQVKLYRDGSCVQTKTTTGRNYNFSQYMSKGGCSYYFTVRAYNKTTSYWSSWEESDEQYVSASQATNNNNTTTTTTTVSPTVITLTSTPLVLAQPDGQPHISGNWIFYNNAWFFQYPNGTYANNTWLQSTGKWYYFNPSSVMLQNGFYTIGASLYYFDSNGAMATGEVTINGVKRLFDANGKNVY